MKTLDLDQLERNDSTRKLFKQLFELTIQLENFRNQHSIHAVEVSALINSIDQLMDALLRSEFD